MNEIRHTYHSQLDDLRVDVVRLGLLATDAITAGTEALLGADLAGAERVIHADATIDDLTRSLEERCYLTLARQQPMASDLRMVVAVLRTIHEIERTGDLMVNVAKTTRRLYPVELAEPIRRIIDQMGHQAGVQMRLAIEAFAESDCVRALALEDMDDAMDDLQRELFRTIFAMGRADEAGLQQMIQVALVGRYYERMADHAVNIGERVNYMVTGEIPGGEAGDGPAAPSSPDDLGIRID
ncbi:MAG TPA: phosphate signaling complex protein PhoU [Acidimicrobiia bacterium]|nr:phosphate signaling complex protein PhoU [Acidimicrobiia bacterium]